MTASVTRVALSALIVSMFAIGTAHAACPDKRASCVLHEEGVALFLEGKHDAAAGKFAAAIAAEPTARSYLGYAQAVESLGQIALAYDTMVAAQRLSTAEIQATGGKDIDVNARGERIKYKLGELRAKIGFVWLRVPEGVAPQRVVSVQRQGEGDLNQPLTQWTAVAPGRQVLVAAIDDGSKLEIIAQVAAGSQGVVVIPLAAPVRQPPTNRPLTSIFVPAPRPPQPVYKTYLALGLSLATGPDQVPNPMMPATTLSASSGTGFTALYERRFGSTIGLATRLEYLIHGESSSVFDEPTVKGSEIIALVGLRTMSSRTVHGRAGIGFSIYTQEINATNGTNLEEFSRLYPAFELGGGLHLGRLRLQMGIMFTLSGDADVELGTRFMGTIGIDLYRK